MNLNKDHNFRHIPFYISNLDINHQPERLKVRSLKHKRSSKKDSTFQKQKRMKNQTPFGYLNLN